MISYDTCLWLYCCKMTLFHSFLWSSNIPMYIYVLCLFYPFINGHLSCFHVLTILNSAAMNTGVYVSFWIIAFSSYMPRTRIIGSYGNSIFSFLRSHHSFLQSGCTNLSSHQWCRKVPFSPHPLQHLFADILMMAILNSVKWYFIVFLICSPLLVSHVEHIFMCLFTICTFSGEVCLEILSFLLLTFHINLYGLFVYFGD